MVAWADGLVVYCNGRKNMFQKHRGVCSLVFSGGQICCTVSPAGLLTITGSIVLFCFLNCFRERQKIDFFLYLKFCFDNQRVGHSKYITDCILPQDDVFLKSYKNVKVW